MEDGNRNGMDRLRESMVRYQIEGRGIRDPKVLASMRAVPRHLFVPEIHRDRAYDDGPLPIGFGQTISQPYIVAFMTEALGLGGGERVLEIGTGSGYQAAVLSRIAGEVHTIERIPELGEMAARTFRRLKLSNIHSRVGDGTRGWPEHSPYEGILVTAGGPDVPRTLLDQLATRGRLVMPVGASRYSQDILLVTRRSADAYDRRTLLSVAFVPLVGEHGWEGPT
jgi:protein-L-isoaspartate(D-aspartate) O-methyltransferase